MSVDLLPEVLLAIGGILVPGAGACLATRVVAGRSFVTFLGVSFALGFAIVSGVALVLARAGAFGPAPLGIGWLAGGTVAWAIALLRGRIPDQARAWRGHLHADPWASAATAAALVGVVVAKWTISPFVNVAPTVLRYWADGLEIADGGQLPDTTLQWGTVLPTAGSKVVLSAFDAAAATLLGRGPIAPLAALMFVVALALILVTIGLFEELGIRRWAPVAALVLYFTPTDLALDLEKNLAEDWGRMVAFAAVLVAVVEFRRVRSPGGDGDTEADRITPRTAVAVAGLLLGLAAGIHLVATCVALAMLTTLALAAALAVRGEAWRQMLARAAAIVGVAVVVGASLLLAAPGDLGFQGAVDQDAYVALRDELSLPDTFDPTLFIAMNDLGGPIPRTAPGLVDVARQYAYRVVGANAYEALPGVGPPPWLVVGPTVLALALAIGLILRGPPDLRAVAIAAVILAIGLFVLGVLFSYRYDVFALEFFGNRRLFPYATIPFVLIAASAAEAAARRLERGRLGTLGASVLTCAVVAAAAVGLLPRDRTPASVADRAAQVALVDRVGQVVPCEGRILSTHRTLGMFQAVAGHAAVLEGMGPHIRPSVLRLAIGEILRAQDFFDDPSAGQDYLQVRGVEAIVVARGSPPYAFGGYRIARVPTDRLDRTPFLRKWFENEAGIVYRVVGISDRRSLPRIAGRPGFACDPSSDDSGADVPDPA